MRWLAMVGLIAAIAAAGASPASPQGRSVRRPSSRPGIVIGEVTWVQGQVLRAEPPDKTAWKTAAAGNPVHTGDTLRTGADAVATLAFPWMTVSLGPSSMLSIPATAVLSTVLDQGRAEFSGAGRDIVKIVVGDAEVRGGGKLILRRASAQTTASALEGTFRVRASGRRVEIRAGQGSVVRAGAPPSAAVRLPPEPAFVQPGSEVGYVRSGRPVELRWQSVAGSAGYFVEVAEMHGSRVLLARESRESPFRVELPWLGTYRWRVFSRDSRGLESRPSAEGLLSVVER